MWRKFSGTISGNGLDPTDVQGDFEETTGTPAPPHRGRFRWAGDHQFQPGQTYRLEIDRPRFYDITITAVHPGPIVEFVTH